MSLVISLIGLIFSVSSFSTELKLLTFNLHAHHPMNEERRLKVYPSGGDTLSDSLIFYFRKEEILRGADKRQMALATDLQRLSPDIVFLQEVASELGELDCSSYLQRNNALDLARRSGHKAYSGCRGNVGWITDEKTFKNFGIQTEKSNKTIFPMGTNPYPRGLVVEGTAILTSSKIRVLKHTAIHVPFASGKGSFFLQWMKFKLKGTEDKWWIAVNLHGGHKVQNFEEAVAARWALSQVINQDPERAQFGGLIVAGDFNAYLPPSEVSTTPWSFFYRWQTQEVLRRELTRLNESGYKDFATLPAREADHRIQSSVQSLFDWFALDRHEWDGSLDEIFTRGKCSFVWKDLNPMCRWSKIDHIFVSSNIHVLEASGIYSHHNWADLKDTLSDHPAVWARIDL
jgi:endonuclease/exonuclease/phosphatase family metal-dependent hydrolase